jgi:hypothetical protein
MIRLTTSDKYSIDKSTLDWHKILPKKYSQSVKYHPLPHQDIIDDVIEHYYYANTFKVDDLWKNAQAPVNDSERVYDDLILQLPEDEEKQVSEKTRLKRQEKKKINKKFVVNHTYHLRTKLNNENRKIFVLKKFIYTINDLPVNILILKQLSGEKNKIFTLSREECKILHIKYEDGLQVWPMDLNWIDLTAKKNRKKSNNKK